LGLYFPLLALAAGFLSTECCCVTAPREGEWLALSTLIKPGCAVCGRTLFEMLQDGKQVRQGKSY